MRVKVLRKDLSLLTRMLFLQIVGKRELDIAEVTIKTVDPAEDIILELVGDKDEQDEGSIDSGTGDGGGLPSGGSP